MTFAGDEARERLTTAPGDIDVVRLTLLLAVLPNILEAPHGAGSLLAFPGCIGYSILKVRDCPEAVLSAVKPDMHSGAAIPLDALITLCKSGVTTASLCASGCRI